MSLLKSDIQGLPSSEWKRKREPEAFPENWKTKHGILRYQRKKPIAQVGERTKRRIAENGTETQLFESVWESRPHVCEMCSMAIPEAMAACFAHRLGKGRYPEYRYVQDNVALVCSEECHHALDATYSLKTTEGAERAWALREKLYLSFRKTD